LLSFDRLGGDELVMAQKLIAKVLDVTSALATASAKALGVTGGHGYRNGLVGQLPVARCAMAGGGGLGMWPLSISSR
jgi:hypothetical protein